MMLLGIYGHSISSADGQFCAPEVSHISQLEPNPSAGNITGAEAAVVTVHKSRADFDMLPSYR